jgi:hypothetical protein
MLTKQRNAPEHTANIQGLAVSANNRDQIRALAAAGTASGIAAVSLAGDVHVVTTDTRAGIAAGASINQSNTGAGAQEGVDVAAADDFYHVGVAGALGIGGAVGAGAGADVSVVHNTTIASLAASRLDALGDVSVNAQGREDFVTASLSAGIGGAAAVAGAVSVLSLNDTTQAYIDSNTTVDAGGSVAVTADDQTNGAMITGSLGVGYGGVGVGGSIGVTLLNKDTEAYIGSGATIDAKGNGSDLNTFTGADFNATDSHARGVEVRANSSENTVTVGVAAGGGFYAGIAGAVSVQSVTAKTQARIDNGAHINTTDAASGANAGQDVNVTARDRADMNAFNGGVAVGAGAIAGSVDIGTIQNDTTAQIGDNVVINAQRDIDVNALGQKNISSTVASAAGGVVGVAGSVSIYSVGRGLDQEGQSRLNTGNGNTTTYADSQASGNSVDSILSGYNDSNVQGISAQAQSQRDGVSSATSLDSTTATGNTARIGSATLTAHHDTNVHAVDGIAFTARAGSLAAGAVGVGAGIVVANLQETNQAYILGNATGAAHITADNNISMYAHTVDRVSGLGFAGAVGLVGADAAVAILNDGTDTSAYAHNAQLNSSADTSVGASDDRTVSADAEGAAFGAGAAGASIATASIGGGSKAYLDGGSAIGDATHAAATATIGADSQTDAVATSVAAAGGIYGGLAGAAATANSQPTVSAYVDGGHDYVAGLMQVQATGDAQAHGSATGVAVAGGLAVGASLAQAGVSPVLSSWLGADTGVNAGSLKILAQESTPTGDHAVSAEATGAAGALIGASATEADATNNSAVTASVGDRSQLVVSGALSIRSVNDTDQFADGLGITAGIVAVGANSANADSSTRTWTDVGNSVRIHGGITGTTLIEAVGSDSNFATATAGSGGVVAGSAAEANTNSGSDTHAQVGSASCGTTPANCGIDAASFDLHARHDTFYNAQVDSTNASVVGASGARANNTVHSAVATGVGTGATVLANDIAIHADNNSNKYWLGASTAADDFATSDSAAFNVKSGSGGFIDAPAGQSKSDIWQNTVVSLGDAAYFHVLMPGTPGSLGSFAIDANNGIVAFDKVKMDSGGAVAVASANSIVDVHQNDATVTLGRNSTVISDSGNIDIGSRDEVQIDARSLVSTYGLAGAPSGTVDAIYNGSNRTEIADGALLVAQDSSVGQGAINVSAGEDSQQRAGSIAASAALNTWNDTVIPINGNPDPRSLVTSNAQVLLDGPVAGDPNSVRSALLAAGNIGLNADRGNISQSAVGVAKDLYREAAAAVVSGISKAFGGGSVSFDLTGGTKQSGGLSNVNADGLALAGLFRESATQINVAITDNSTGQLVNQIDTNTLANGGYTYSLVFSPLADGSNPDPNPRDPAGTPNPYISYIHYVPNDPTSPAQVSTASPSSLLQARIDKLVALETQYAADPVASQAYAAEIKFLLSKQGPQGISTPATSDRATAANQFQATVNSALSTDQIPFTGDLANPSLTGPGGELGTLLAAYASIDATNNAIDAQYRTESFYTANSGLANYVLLNSGRSAAAGAINRIGTLGSIDTATATSYSTAFGSVSAPKITGGTGDLLTAQQAMVRLKSDSTGLASLLTQRTRTAADSAQVVTNAWDMSTQLGTLSAADHAIVGEIGIAHSNLAAAAALQGPLATAFATDYSQNPAVLSTATVDTDAIARVTTVLVPANNVSGRIPDFNPTPATGTTDASQMVAQDTDLAGRLAAVASGASGVQNASDAMKAGLMSSVVDLPAVQVNLGNVNVKADSLTGSGSLEAPGNARILIVDNAPATLNVNALSINGTLSYDSQGNPVFSGFTGGNVTFNGFRADSLSDLQRAEPAAFASGNAPTLTLVTAANGAAGSPSISIISNYDPSQYCNCVPTYNPDGTIKSYPTTLGPITDPTQLWKLWAAPAPDINLNAPVNNLQGSFSVESQAGDIYSNAPVSAGSISILARNGDYVQQYINGFATVSGDPAGNSQGGSNNFQNGGAAGAGDVANGNIFISARYVNINGLVQSGITNYHLDIANDSTAQWVTAAPTWTVSGGGQYSVPAYGAGWTSCAASGAPAACGGNTAISYYGITLPSGAIDAVVYDPTAGKYLVDTNFLKANGVASPVTLYVDPARNDVGAIKVSYDSANQQIVVDGSNVVRGGFIQLFGQIINTADPAAGTGAGKLAVLDGYGQVAINNKGSLGIQLKPLDTGLDPSGNGTGVAGTIDITDVQYVQFDSLSGKYIAPEIRTIIQRDRGTSGDAGTLKVSQTGMWDSSGAFCANCYLQNGTLTGYVQADGSLASIGTPLTEAYNNGSTGSVVDFSLAGSNGRNAAYSPQAGLRYVYTTAQSTTTTYTWVYSGTQFFGSSSLQLAPSTSQMSLTSGPIYGTRVPLDNGTYLSYSPVSGQVSHQNGLGQNVLPTDQAVANGNGATRQTGIGVASDVLSNTNSFATSAPVFTFLSQSSNCDWWSLCITQTYTSYWKETAGGLDVTTNSVKADHAIGVEFLGANTPTVSVLSTGPVTLNGPIRNVGGQTSITGSSVSAAGAGGLITTKDLSLTATAGSIGSSSQSIPVLTSGVVNAGATQGSVYLSEIAGALKFGDIHASGTPFTLDAQGRPVSSGLGQVVLQATDDIVGVAGSSITGERIELASTGGSILSQDADGSLKIYAGYTADPATQPFYGLKAGAQGNIDIAAQKSSVAGSDASGDLLVDTVGSIGGDVTLSAPGQILDNNPIQSIDQRVYGELLNFWNSVGLVAGSADHAAKVTQAIDALENSKTSDYAQYWQIRNSQNPPVTQTASWTYTASAGEQAAIAAQVTRANPGLDAADLAAKVSKAISDFQTSRTAQYWTLNAEVGSFDAMTYARAADAARIAAADAARVKANPGATPLTQAQIDSQVLADEAAGTLNPGASSTGYVAGFRYVASAADRNPYETTGAWTPLQLALSANPGLLKNITDTNPVIKTPNVSGRNVVITAGTNLGTTTSSPVIIPYSPDPASLTDAQKVALATAEYSDYTFDDVNQQIVIAQRQPLNFNASVGLTATVTDPRPAGTPAGSDLGNAYLASLGSGLLQSVSAAGEVRLKVKGSIVSTAAPGVPAVQAGSLILESANGGIGYIPGDDTAVPPVAPTIQPLRVDLAAGGSLTARAGDNIYLLTPGDADIGGIFSRGDIHFDAGGSIFNAFADSNLRMLGDNLYLSAVGAVGDHAAPFGVGVVADGRIHVTAGQGVYLNGPTLGPVRSYFNIGSIASGDAVQLSADGDMLIDGTVAGPGPVQMVAGNMSPTSGKLSMSGNADVESAAGNIDVVAGSIDMADGSRLAAAIGTVAMATTGDAIVTGVSSGNAGADAVRISSSGGRILDGGDTRVDITATAPGAVVTLSAAGGVGVATRRPDGTIAATANPLEIDAARLDGTSSGGGFQAAGSGALTVGQITAAGDIGLFGIGGPIVFANDAGLTVTGNGAVWIQNGLLGRRLTVNTPLTRLVVDAVDKRHENVDVKVYVPGRFFDIGLAGRTVWTDGFVLQRAPGYETYSPAGTDSSVESVILDELAKGMGATGEHRRERRQQRVPATIELFGPVVSIDGAGEN